MARGYAMVGLDLVAVQLQLVEMSKHKDLDVAKLVSTAGRLVRRVRELELRIYEAKEDARSAAQYAAAAMVASFAVDHGRVDPGEKDGV